MNRPLRSEPRRADALVDESLTRRASWTWPGWIFGPPAWTGVLRGCPQADGSLRPFRPAEAVVEALRAVADRGTPVAAERTNRGIGW